MRGPVYTSIRAIVPTSYAKAGGQQPRLQGHRPFFVSILTKSGAVVSVVE